MKTTETATPTVVSPSYLPVLPLLGAVLTVLKVLGKITLAWKWVLAPFWIPALIGFGVLVGFVVLAIIGALIAAFLD